MSFLPKRIALTLVESLSLVRILNGLLGLLYCLLPVLFLVGVDTTLLLSRVNFCLGVLDRSFRGALDDTAFVSLRVCFSASNSWTFLLSASSATFLFLALDFSGKQWAYCIFYPQTC